MSSCLYDGDKGKEWEPEKKYVHWDTTPSPILSNGYAIPDLCDVYDIVGTSIYVWYKFVPCYEDLTLVRCGETLAGRVPNWFDRANRHYDENSDPTNLVDCQSVVCENVSFYETYLNLALAWGVAPGQPFIIRIKQPEYSYSYYGEADEDFECEPLRCLKWTSQEVAKAWITYSRLFTAYRARFLHKDKSRCARRAAQLHNWDLRKDNGFSKGDVYLTLYHVPKSAKPIQTVMLTSHGESYKAAFEQLRAKVSKQFGQSAAYHLYSLTEGAATPSCWDRLQFSPE